MPKAPARCAREVSLQTCTDDGSRRIIIWAKENNYEFCRIEENMDPVHHRIAN